MADTTYGGQSSDVAQCGHPSVHKLHCAAAYNGGDDTVYLHVFDVAGFSGATPLANGIEPEMIVAVQPGGNAVIDYGTSGRPMRRGIAVALSTTETSLTSVNPDDVDCKLEFTYSRP